MPLARRLGLTDAVFVGLGSMIGAGVFAAFAPAARAAGAGLLPALAIAAVVAYCNAASSARLAARYPESGGTYVYGRARLGDFWGYLAGWGFITGKTASCAAMTLTVVAYAAPDLGKPWRTVLAVCVVALVTSVNYLGVHRSALATRVIVCITLVVLTVVSIAGVSTDHTTVAFSPFFGNGVLEAAGLLFFAFAGYARLATLGEEVRDPARTIPRAIPIALACTLVVYAAIALVLLTTLGPARLAQSTDPLAEAAPWPWLAPVVRIGATVAALGSLLALVLGVSRTMLAMSRDGHLPRALSAVHPRFQVPHRAELTVGVIVAILASFTDLRNAIGFSSFAVLAYYAIANAAAMTLRHTEGATRRFIAISVVGLIGCLVLAFSLPLTSVLAGVAVLGIGAAVYGIRRMRPRQ
ncbi:APC family permease [Amycolatopsis panacis]|uniref:Amino acid permease n=1 Tax=Amycolatopsis panacis TaxID=2340917 RepID=A0A419I1I5_9PSEU|nr:amino acid permease [Amycolatopsis panacis]RJQ83575.1 amino acid permease [Amycolatopsis panacis]